jgi:histidyl-tRNA synthetase
MKIASVKGTRDFYPDDMTVRNWICDAWRRVSVRNGFLEYDGPILEYLDLYKAKSGEGIVGELFHLQDRGGRELAIRPEMTPTLARMINQRAGALPRPIKWFSVPRMCRAERPQRGRLREFFQWNVDIVGVDDLIADAECIFVMVDFLREIGLTEADVVMKYNSRRLVGTALGAMGFSPEETPTLLALLDKQEKVPPDTFERMLDESVEDPARRAAMTSLLRVKCIEGLTEQPWSQAASTEIGEVKRLSAMLELMGVSPYCEFSLSVVRGLAYYTGSVFEAFGREGGLRRAICGGGRYDELLSVLGGPPMSGVGFATSDVVIQDLLAERGLLPDSASSIDVFVIDADASFFSQAVQLASKLRSKGFSAGFSYKRQSVGKQMGQASAQGADRVAILGLETAERGTVTVKEMSTGRQSEIPLEAFIASPAVWHDDSS